MSDMCDEVCDECADTDVPLQDGLCERCWIEWKDKEKRKKQQEYSDRLKWGRN